MSIDGRVWQSFQDAFIGNSEVEVAILLGIAVVVTLGVLWILSKPR